MIRIFLPLLCAVLGLAAASCSQTEGSFGRADSAGSPPGAAAAAMASPPGAPQELQPAQAGAQPSAPAGTEAASNPPAQHRASTLIGMPVVSAGGSALGEVKDIIFDAAGRATHVVISYGTQSPTGAASAAGRLVAMPWEAAIACISEGRLVLDSSSLAGAPGFTPEAWPDFDDPAWSATADAYWRKLVRPAVAAHGSNPIDSTTRRRSRRTRDGGGD
jgi:sporulation protein YlmC with PRC-barrel domain